MAVGGFGINGKSYYSNIAKPIDVNMAFMVDATNVNGLGISSLKSNGYVNNVFMHTSATPGVNNGYTNPNPAVGYILVQLKNNFNHYINKMSAMISSLTSPMTAINSGLVVGDAYMITSLGNTTAAQWQSIGVPVGVTPAVGMSFIATAVGTGVGPTGTVGLPVPSGIQTVEVIGNPDVSIANDNVSKNGGAWVLLACYGATSASDTTLIPVAPLDYSVVTLNIRMDGSSVTVDGL
jgi:hypothetical protein